MQTATRHQTLWQYTSLLFLDGKKSKRDYSIMLRRSLLMYSSFGYSWGMEEEGYSGIFLEFLSILCGPVWLICSCWKIHELCPPPKILLLITLNSSIISSFTVHVFFFFCGHEGFYRNLPHPPLIRLPPREEVKNKRVCGDLFPCLCGCSCPAKVQILCN